jgi:exodeoxyribonuclease-3
MEAPQAPLSFVDSCTMPTGCGMEADSAAMSVQPVNMMNCIHPDNSPKKILSFATNHFDLVSKRKTMRIITYNVNGIRAAIRKGFLDWLKTDPADVICLQEIKASLEDIDTKAIAEAGYQSAFFCAEKKGYSGVGILSKVKPKEVVCGSQMPQSDLEGRVIHVDFGKITVISAYFPSGTTGDIRQQYKYEWLDDFYRYVQTLMQTKKNLVIAGDFNIAHKPIDLHNPASNKNSSGFLPEERAWMDRFFDLGFVDGFRVLNQEPHQYTWWHQLRPQTRLDNKGWRIDYIALSKHLASKVQAVAIYPEVKHSDHCAVMVDLKI